jgi:trimeric autotransporter adhesin
MRVLFPFILSVVALPATAQTLSIVSGHGLIAQENFGSTKPLVVRATNAAGAGVADVPITWTVKQGGGQVFNASVKTDANGYAQADFFGERLIQGESYATSTINAAASFGSVDFVASTVSTHTVGGTFVGAPSFELIPPTVPLTGPPGTVFPRAFGVRVIALGGFGVGSGIPFIGVRVAPPELPGDAYASCSGASNTVLTDAQGYAYCDLVLGQTTGSNFLTVVLGEISQYNRIIPITVTAGTACTFGVSPLTQNIAGAGASGTIAVTVATGQGCNWVASTTTPWITITSGASGQANGTVGYTVAPNAGPARSGVITVAGQSVTVNQAAAGTIGGGPISFTFTSPLPGGTQGSQYSLNLGISGGTAPYLWTATGTFPPGLGLGATNGSVTGVPNTPGTFAFTLKVTDATGASVSQPFTMTIAAAPAPGTFVITTTSLPSAAIGAAYQQTVNVTGACNQNPFGGGSVNWVLASGSLPPGLNLVPAGTAIAVSGTPTTEGTFNFALRAADTCGKTDTKNFSVTVTTTVVQSPMIATPAAIDFSVAYTAPSSGEQSVALSTGTTPVTFNATTPTPWLTIAPAQGSTPNTLTVRAVNIGAFLPGTYTGAVVITSGASNSPVSIPVTLRIAASSNITVSKESLVFRLTAAAPIGNDVIVVGGISLGTRFTVSTSTESGGQWLSVNPTRGETNLPISVVANATGLAPGNYNGSIQFTPDQNGGGRIIVPVTVVVSPASSLTFAQQSLSFNGPGSQSIAIGTTNGAPLAFTATTTGGAWLTVDPASGNAPASLAVRVALAGLPQGTSQGSVVITPANGGQPTVIPVTVNVSQGQPVITGVTNAASFAPGVVAPGELITIFGTNLGPAQLVSGDFDVTNTLPSTVSNIRVMFDNVPAPIIYVASGQISAIVPFGVFGRTGTRVQVVNNGLTSNAYDLQIGDAMPGIFVLDTNGQGAIINQDGTINARVNGAEPGSIVAIYATGGGQVDRQVFDGRRVTDTPFPKPLLPVGVRIGGRVADVTYIGAAPGLVAGMLQVNARVPDDTPRGTAVPVQIIIGTATSQQNVFLSVKP